MIFHRGGLVDRFQTWPDATLSVSLIGAGLLILLVAVSNMPPGIKAIILAYVILP